MQRGTQTLALAGVVIALAVAGCAGIGSSSTSSGGNVNSGGTSSSTTTTTQTTPAAPQTFTGSGTENLGTIRVPTDSLLTWKCSCVLQGAGGVSVMEILSDLNSDGNEIVITSSASSGQSEVSADTYANVQVGATGPFTITITANG